MSKDERGYIEGLDVNKEGKGDYIKYVIERSFIIEIKVMYYMRGHGECNNEIPVSRSRDSIRD